MFVEFNEASNALNYVSLLVHNNDCCCSQAWLHLEQSIEVHEHIITNPAYNNTLEYIVSHSATLAHSTLQLLRESRYLDTRVIANIMFTYKIILNTCTHETRGPSVKLVIAPNSVTF